MYELACASGIHDNAGIVLPSHRPSPHLKPRNVKHPTSAMPGPGAMSDKQPAEPKAQYPGRRFAQIVKLKPDSVDEYKKVHAAVWPEVLKQVRDCNIVDYSIFHDPETCILFASFKYIGDDYAKDMECMRENPKVREWWRMTDGMQESMVLGAKNSESAEPGWWRPVEEVFYFKA
ncbi:DUF718-domain-containing protein [Parathielavia hyrcaniae]|uniref:DUF718-domain-containing protein n=1 Tax=Parathielavia hyrcaniae TaxID=113614 RepID=A0AAN6PRG8_9PEZI|nr:DUF718-domain-containing protein [Parathielavia hyrcaniae]